MTDDPTAETPPSESVTGPADPPSPPREEAAAPKEGGAPPSGSPARESSAGAAPAAADGGGGGGSAPDVAVAFATGADVPAADGQASAPSADGGDPKRKKRRKKKPAGAGGRPERGDGPGHGRGSGHGGPAHGGRQMVEDNLDRDAEHLARDARTVPHARIRPIAECSRQVRRLMASRNARDHREARRALVMLKSKVAFLAGREIGRERSALNKLRDAVFHGVDQLVRNKDDLDRGALRNFLDQLDAFVGYHRYTSDERRRD